MSDQAKKPEEKKEEEKKDPKGKKGKGKNKKKLEAERKAEILYNNYPDSKWAKLATKYIKKD